MALSLMDIITIVVGGVMLLVVGLIAVLSLLFPRQMQAISNLVNLELVRESCMDIGSAVGQMTRLPLLGSILSGILLGIAGVWVLLKGGKIEEFRQFGKSVGTSLGGDARGKFALRMVCVALCPIVTVGILAIGAAKFSIDWPKEALYEYWRFMVFGEFREGRAFK